MAFMKAPKKDKSVRLCSNCNAPLDERFNGKYIVFTCDKCDNEIKYKSFG